MMKKIIVALTILAATFGFSSAVSWEAHGFDATNTELGKAYLLQIVDTSVTIAGIQSHLATKGTEATDAQKAKFKLWGEAAKEVAGTGKTNATPTNNPNTTIPNNAPMGFYTFVVIFVEGDQVTVSDAISGMVMATPGSDGTLPPQDVKFGDNNFATASTEWYTVPEPTVLALLALGVAGLALRRRA